MAGYLDVFISTKEIAKALMQRLSQSLDVNDLANVKILLFSCLGHDFAENVVAHMRKIYDSARFKQYREKIGATFADIKLPTIITSGQQGSIAVSLLHFLKVGRLIFRK